MNRRTLLSALMTSTFAFGTGLFAQDTANVPVRPNVPAIAEQNVKQLLLLMDSDKNGKISKAEWMKFMSEEFDRLDTDKSGELDRNELLKSRIVMRHVSPETQGK
jgi:Ca2+-binding EF-hand superfamily protein